MISISIISHQQFPLIQKLLEDLDTYCKTDIEVLLTFNLPEAFPQDFSKYTFPIQTIINATPKGFGTNHNAAFLKATHPFFCVLNPDIRLLNNPFPHLLQQISQKDIGVATPSAVNENGQLQDNARKFLTVRGLAKRLFKIADYDSIPSHPDWIAGMFMLFRKEVYAEVGGFDEHYYMYCEDMDLCKRLKQKNYSVFYDKSQKIIHHAQRKSHKNIHYLLWHLQSLLRYFSKPLKDLSR